MENRQLIKEVTAKAKRWLTEDYDAQTRAAVQAMLDKEDKTELIESFYKDLEFGTGGLRGIMGPGSNRVNQYTVGAATQGLANYLNKSFAHLPRISVVIGHDCRNNSRFFAEICADVFSANGIYVYLFDDLRPTPEVSFAIRHLKCQSGVILTASHNPKEYNGYKAYWDDGAQVVPPHDNNIIDEVQAIKDISSVRFEGNKELIKLIGAEIDEKYIEQIKTISLSPEAIRKHEDLKIVYTPIHGTGVRIIPACLRAFGFKNIINVPEQDVVSGDFPTVVSPNPEEPAALSLALKRAAEVDADIVMASDPDSDRLGIAIKNDREEWMLVNGHQTALIFIYYLIKRRSELGMLESGKEFIVKTIVTTELIKEIADRHKVDMFDTYTGFKWIAAIIREFEGKRQYIGGGEESYGFLPQDFVRDKDAVSSCALMAEILAWAKEQGKSLYELLLDIYIEYGLSREKGISVVKKGKSGAEQIKSMMDNFRSKPVNELAGSPVILIKDYMSLKAYKPESGESFDLKMPETSNVLQYFSHDGTKVSIRPSGTEPKIKFYIEVRDVLKSYSEYPAKCELAEDKFKRIMKSLGL
ncbi:MAG TPA: phospho-sugar mutase [Bacteroidales bacterium]|nr:phospho-sugar mutase [Bacteroidales bacterium]